MVLGAAPGSDMGATASVSCRHWSSPPEAHVAAMKVAAGSSSQPSLPNSLDLDRFHGRRRLVAGSW